MTTPIDRESVERPWASPLLSSLLEQMANQPSALDSYVIASGASMAITEIRALRAALDAAEAENKRLREQMVNAVWEEYQDSIVNKWTFRKEHVQNAIAKAAAIRAQGET